MNLRRFLWTALLVLLPATAQAETYLLMAEEHGCMWCERWNDEIAPIYPKTAEGKVAPLVRYDIHGDGPIGVEVDGPVHFTPTFILVRNGREIDRMEGYPGEDFFWSLLSIMLKRAEIALLPEPGKS